MSKVDQFESVFKSAARSAFEYAPVSHGRVLVVSDRVGEAADGFASSVRAFLRVLDRESDVRWRSIGGEDYDTVGDLLALVEEDAPDLVCTYRHLHSTAWRWPYSLGEHLDILLQRIAAPVLVMPHPDRQETEVPEGTRAVMALTDHLTGDGGLINAAVALTESGGTLHLAHVEDERAFERLIEVISKIPSIDTDAARESIRARLMKEPADYLSSCRRVLEESGVNVELSETVTMGRHLASYRDLVERLEVDLLVMNTKDEDQLAMHGLAYPLAVELRRTPLLML